MSEPPAERNGHLQPSGARAPHPLSHASRAVVRHGRDRAPLSTRSHDFATRRERNATRREVPPFLPSEISGENAQIGRVQIVLGPGSSPPPNEHVVLRVLAP